MNKPAKEVCDIVLNEINLRLRALKTFEEEYKVKGTEEQVKNVRNRSDELTRLKNIVTSLGCDTEN